jgi:hypothetical protein
LFLKTLCFKFAASKRGQHRLNAKKINHHRSRAPAHTLFFEELELGQKLPPL